MIFFYLSSLTIMQIPIAYKYIPIMLLLFVFVLFFIDKGKIRKEQKNDLLVFLSMIVVYLYSVIFNFSVMSMAYLVFSFFNVLFINYYSYRDNIFDLKTQLKLYYIIFLVLLLIPIFRYGSIVSVFVNANNYALVAVFLVLIAHMIFEKKYLYLNLFVLYFLIFLSSSRSALLLLFIFYTYYLILKYFPKVKMLLLFSLFIFMLLYFVVLNNSEVLQEFTSLNEIKILGKNLLSLSSRDTLFKISIGIIPENFFGLGLGNASHYIGNITGINLSPHNTYLKISMEAGIIALVVYFLIIIYVLKQMKTPLFISFFIAYHFKALFESATPFSISLISACLILPYFLERIYLNNLRKE